MYTGRSMKGNEAAESTIVVEKRQKFVEKIQNPKTKTDSEDTIDGNVGSATKGTSVNHSFSLDELPDGSHISPVKAFPFQTKDTKFVKPVKGPSQVLSKTSCKYIGSFRVTGTDQNERVEFVKNKLIELRDVHKSKDVVLVISLNGIKVCSPEEQTVYMAHALKRISYATCDLMYNQFSFLAREPKSDTSIQHCHAFLTRTQEEADELNTLIGRVFKLAFENVLRQPTSTSTMPSENISASAPTFNEVIEQQMSDAQRRSEEDRARKQQQLQNRLSVISTPTVDEQMKELKEKRKKELEEIERQKEAEILRGKERLAWAKNVAGRTKHKSPLQINTLVNNQRDTGDGSNNNNNGQRTPKIYRELLELKDLLNAAEAKRTYGSPVVTLKDTIDMRFEMNGGILFDSDGSETDTSTLTNQPSNDISNRPLPKTPESPPADGLLSRRHSEPFQNNGVLTSKDIEINDSDTRKTPTRQQSCPNPPSQELSLPSDHGKTAWYQKGVERGVALEYLSQQPTGSFIVRDSSTQKGCYALSIKVPKYENPSGISHYLIIKTSDGNVKLKGMEKEWPDLESLVTHHSVIRDNLPCTLKFPTEANNPVFCDEAGDDMEDDNDDQDYQRKFSDCTEMIQLNV